MYLPLYSTDLRVLEVYQTMGPYQITECTYVSSSSYRADIVYRYTGLRLYHESEHLNQGTEHQNKSSGVVKMTVQCVTQPKIQET